MVIASSANPASSTIPSFAVWRGRLIGRLNAAAEVNKLTVVSAPAGFGKSVLLSQWVASRRGLATVWLSLSRFDNDATTLLARLDRLPEITLVLDDLDAVTNAAAVAKLAELIEKAPPSLHVVAASRSDLPQCLKAVQRQGGLAGLDQVDLAFRDNEARSLLQRVSGRAVTARQVGELVARTAGWATGLQLAAMALRESRDVDQFIAHFHGTDRTVDRYLTDEVLSSLPVEMMRFLARTSVLKKMSGSLCDALTGSSDGWTVLRQLECRSLFIDRLKTDSGEWFVYQPLFRDVLLHQLHLREPGVEPDLLARAARWHLARDDIDTAVAYLLAAQDWDATIELIHRHGRDLFEQGRPSDLLGWMEAMPAGALAASPRGALEHASVQTMVGNTLAAQEIIRELDLTHSLSAEEQVIADGLRASWVQFHASPDSVARASRSVMRILNETPGIEPVDVFGLTSPASLRTVALGSRAAGLWHGGQVEEARTALKDLAESDDTFDLWKVSVLGALALLEAWSGRLCLAEQYALEALTSAGQQRPDPQSIDALLAMAGVLRERNRIRQAVPYLDGALALATTAQRSVSLAVQAGERALLNLAQGQPVAGLRCITAFRLSGHPPPPFAIETRLRAIEGRLLLELGRDAQADLVLVGEDREKSTEMSAVALQAAVARRDIQAARELLRSWPSECRDIRSELLHGLWNAIVGDFEGGRRDTLDQLARVVSLAEPEGHARLLLDAGDDAVRLLRRLLRTRPTAYLRTILHPPNLPPPSRPAEAVAVLKSLTERELLVLQYVPSRLSNSEMAAHLYVSTNTVKTHLRSIYQKLGVSGRKDAAKKAEHLGLV